MQIFIANLNLNGHFLRLSGKKYSAANMRMKKQDKPNGIM
jgi:hypothetical protein